MASLEHLQQLMAEVGPLVDQIEAVGQVADHQWIVDYQGVTIEIEFVDSSRKMVFSSDLGPAPEENRLAAYELLLVANSLWRETDGISLALDEPGGSILLIYDSFTLELDAGALATVIENLLAKADAWKKALADLKGSQDQDEDPARAEGPDDSHPGGLPGGLRV